MIMTKEKRFIEKEDLIVFEEYAKNRKKIRKDLVEFKKNRRVSIGPYATFYFESFETMLAQVQEMLHIEKGGDEQLKDELNAYNPLIPKGKELVATLMFEIDDPTSRVDFLGKVGGIEEKIYIKVGEEIIKAVPENDVDRTSSEGKASSVQFVHFNFSSKQIKKFKDLNNNIQNQINLISQNTKKSEEISQKTLELENKLSKEISEICKKYQIPLHTDAVQAVGKVPINVKELGVDALSVSSHKINGPKGIGALFIKKGLRVTPQILGGGQENGMRSGTENVASIVGFGKACEIAKERLNENISHFQTLHSTMLSRVIKEISHVKLNGHSEKRIFNNIHLTFMGVNGEDLIIKLDEHGIAASTGSACSMHTQKASHVLQALGFNHEQITGSLRMSFGYLNTLDEFNQTIDVLKKVVIELRSVSPYKTKYNF